MLDIVRHDGATGRSIGPEPDERYPVETLGLHGKHQQPFEDPFHGSIDRPAWKEDRFPIPEMRALEVLPHRDRQEWAEPVVHASDQCVGSEWGSLPGYF